MAKKETISRDALIQAAFSILREEGIGQVTARKLAARANCSTQPIFRIYRNMEEVSEELFGRACDFFQDYYSDFPEQAAPPFVNLGQAYIKFAGEHKKVFEFLFLSPERFGRSLYDIIDGSGGCVTREVQAALSQGCRDAGNVFMKMWIFIHGAACMCLTGDYELSEDETMQALMAAYDSFK